MGFPICVEEYSKGGDCGCFPPGKTPKYLNATVSGVTLCPQPVCQDIGAPLNGRWLLTQDPVFHCHWAGVKHILGNDWEAVYETSPNSFFIISWLPIITFQSALLGPCVTTLSNTVACEVFGCGTGGKAVITINFAADVLRGANLWPSRVRRTAERIWRYTNTWYEKDIKDDGRTTFRFADDTKNLHLLVKFDPFLRNIETPGIIIMWYGFEEGVPDGWALCDGTQGTPDLRDRFLRAAGPGFPPDATGGSLTHTHAFTGDGHIHFAPVGTEVAAPGAAFNDRYTVRPATGTTGPNTKILPYMGLYYIMRLV